MSTTKEINMTTYTTADGSKTVIARKGYEANEALGTEDTIYGYGPEGWCASTGGSGAGEGLVGEGDIPAAARLAIERSLA